MRNRGIEARIRKLNPNAQIFRTQQSKVDPKELINIDSFNLEETLKMDPAFLDTEGMLIRKRAPLAVVALLDCVQFSSVRTTFATHISDHGMVWYGMVWYGGMVWWYGRGL